MADSADDEIEYIDEDPLTRREIEHALAPYLTRKERKVLIDALIDAELLVFRA